MRPSSAFVTTGDLFFRAGQGLGRGTALGAALTLLLASVPVGAAPPAGTESPLEVRLVLQITVDGLRGDLLNRYGDRFGEGGFRSLLERGTVFTNAHHEHANTETIVGHATLATGAHPSGHGMIGNVWYDREARELAYNIEDPEAPLLPTRADAVTGEQVDRPRRSRARRGARPARSWPRRWGTRSRLSRPVEHGSSGWEGRTAARSRWRVTSARPSGTPPTPATS